MTDSQSAAAARASSRREDERAETKRARKRALLDVATRLFLERGFGNTSVSAIVQEAGVAQGTFYLYFSSKQKVLLHLRAGVLEAYVAAFEDAARPAFDEPRPEPADARLVRGIRRISDAVDEHRDLVRVFREATSSEELQRVWIEGRRRLVEPLSAVIGDGADDGSFTVDDPMLAAHVALAIFDDLLYEALEFSEPATLHVTLAHATRFLLRALRAPEARVLELVPLPPT